MHQHPCRYTQLTFPLTQIVWMFNNKPLTEYFSEALALSNGTLLIQDATRFTQQLFYLYKSYQCEIIILHISAC